MGQRIQPRANTLRILERLVLVCTGSLPHFLTLLCRDTRQRFTLRNRSRLAAAIANVAVVAPTSLSAYYCANAALYNLQIWRWLTISAVFSIWRVRDYSTPLCSSTEPLVIWKFRLAASGGLASSDRERGGNTGARDT